jgi:hypothetical protein
MSAPVLPFTVHRGGRRAKRRTPAPAPKMSPLMQKIAQLEVIRPNAVKVLEMLADRFLANYRRGMPGA